MTYTETIHLIHNHRDMRQLRLLKKQYDGEKAIAIEEHIGEKFYEIAVNMKNNLDLIIQDKK